MASDEDAKEQSEGADVSAGTSGLKSAALASFGTAFKKSEQELQKEAEIAALRKKKGSRSRGVSGGKKTKDASELFKSMSAGGKKSEQELEKEREMRALKKRKKKKISSASDLWKGDAAAPSSQGAATAGELDALKKKKRRSSGHKKAKADMSFLGKEKASEQSTQGSQTANELAAMRGKKKGRKMDFSAANDKSVQGAETSREMEALKKNKRGKSLSFLNEKKGPSVQGKQALVDIKRMAGEKAAKEKGLDFLTRQDSNGSKLWAKLRRQRRSLVALSSRGAMLSRFQSEAAKKKTSDQGRLAEREKARLAASEDDQLAYLEGDAVFEALAKLLARQSPKRRVETVVSNELVVKPHQGHYQGFTQKAFFALVNTPYSTATPQQQGKKVSAVLRDKQAKDLSWRHVVYIFKSKPALKEFQTGMAKYAYHKGKCRQCILANSMTDLYIPLTDARVEILPKGDPRLVERDPASKLPQFEFFVTIPDPEEPGEAPDHRYNFLAYSAQERELWVNAIKQAAGDDTTTIESEELESSRPARLKQHVNSLQAQLSAAARRHLTLAGVRCARFAQSTIPSFLERVHFFGKQEARSLLQRSLRRHLHTNDGRARFLHAQQAVQGTCQARLRSRALRMPLLEYVLEQKKRRCSEHHTVKEVRGQYLAKRRYCLVLQAALATAQGLPQFIKQLHSQKIEARKRAVAEARAKWQNIDRDWEAARQRKVEGWAQNAARGATFHKYPATSKGKPAERGVAVVGGRDGCIVWFKPGKAVPKGLDASAKNCFRIASIKNVTPGRKSTAFAQNSKGKHSADLCFSINYGSRTLDLAARNANDYRMWMDAFDVLLDRDARPKKGPDPDTIIPPVREPYLPPALRPTDI